MKLTDSDFRVMQDYLDHTCEELDIDRQVIWPDDQPQPKEQEADHA